MTCPLSEELLIFAGVKFGHKLYLLHFSKSFRHFGLLKVLLKHSIPYFRNPPLLALAPGLAVHVEVMRQIQRYVHIDASHRDFMLLCQINVGLSGGLRWVRVVHYNALSVLQSSSGSLETLLLSTQSITIYSDIAMRSKVAFSQSGLA